MMIIVAILLIVNAKPQFSDAATPVFYPGYVTLHTASGKHRLKVELATTPAAWEHGMMFRRAWDGLQGMLFIFPQETKQQMWMKNTYLPLDIVFISGHGTIVHLVERAPPESTDLIKANTLSDKVLELPVDSIQNYQLALGDQVTYEKAE